MDDRAEAAASGGGGFGALEVAAADSAGFPALDRAVARLATAALVSAAGTMAVATNGGGFWGGSFWEASRWPAEAVVARCRRKCPSSRAACSSPTRRPGGPGGPNAPQPVCPRKVLSSGCGTVFVTLLCWCCSSWWPWAVVAARARTCPRHRGAHGPSCWFRKTRPATYRRGWRLDSRPARARARPAPFMRKRACSSYVYILPDRCAPTRSCSPLPRKISTSCSTDQAHFRPCVLRRWQRALQRRLLGRRDDGFGARRRGHQHLQSLPARTTTT